MTPQFLFDFASPNAYLAYRVLPAIEQRTGTKFEYMPVLLGGIFKLANNRAPMIAFAEVKGKMAYEMLELERFIRRYQITKYRFNPNFPVNTLTLMRMAVAARQAGELAPFVGAAFHFMWEDPRKMDDPAVIRASLAEAGLDAERLLAAAQSPEIKKQLTDDTEAAVARGVFGIPTFFVGAEMFFGKDRLDQVEEAIRTAEPERR
jgi:2-hydroxychromene-2-carboxylate isomerase